MAQRRGVVAERAAHAALRPGPEAVLRAREHLQRGAPEDGRDLGQDFTYFSTAFSRLLFPFGIPTFGPLESNLETTKNTSPKRHQGEKHAPAKRLANRQS